MFSFRNWLKTIICAPLAVFMGAIPSASGSPDFTRSGDARIPEVYSKVYRKKLYDKVLAANITNTDHTGELTKVGDTVIINTVPTVVWEDWYKGKPRNWQQAKSDPVIMRVNRARDFNVVQPVSDAKQFWDKDFLGTLADDSQKQISTYIDRTMLASVYSSAATYNQGATAGMNTGMYNLGVTGTPVGVSKANVVNYFHNVMSCVASEANWDDDDCFVAVPTWMRGLMNVSDYKDESMTGQPSSLRGGRFGKVGKFQCYETNLYTSIADGSGKTCFPVIFGTKDAIAFVSQLIDTEFFPKLEATAGAGLTGIQLFDWSVIFPQALGVLYCYAIQPN
jgi:hypothetical protein